MKIEYKDLTNFVYSNLSWGPLFRDKKTDKNSIIKNLDTSAEKYITDSLKIMNMKVSNLKNKNVFDVGTGRQSRFFAKQGAIVDHIDIAKDSVLALQDWAKENNKPVTSKHGDIADHELTKNKYDIIFLMVISAM